MYRLLNLTDYLGTFAAGVVIYKLVEAGPYEASLLVGRTLHIFIVALQGYI